jgi:hypothetical protein
MFLPANDNGALAEWSVGDHRAHIGSTAQHGAALPHQLREVACMAQHKGTHQGACQQSQQNSDGYRGGWCAG